jgi:PAS domain S-box-containing protein
MDAIVTIDKHLLIQIFNAAAENVFRCKAEQAIGQSFERFASEALRQLLTDCVHASERRPMSKRYMWAPEGLTAVRADGEAFPVEATISQVEASGQKLYTIIMRDVNDRQQAEKALRELQRENIYLREEVKTGLKFEDIVGESDAIRKVLDSVEQVAMSDSTVLITGETGTGKELIARAIHNLSARRGKLLVMVNCAALPVGLIESELFGHEKGAFTGALTRQIGRFELADGGTIFLDEIGDLPLELQAKILRVLQEGEFERVGGSKTLKVDVRVIAATNQDLEQALEQQRFRPDLYYRVNVFPIRMPCLRERTEDIPLLARHFAMMYSARMGKKIDEIPPSVLQALSAYHWPGNIRELQNVMERAVIISRGTSLEIGEWPPKPIGSEGASRILTLEELEREHILEILRSTGWRVSGEKGAAKILGMKPTTLQARMTKFGIKRPD